MGLQRFFSDSAVIFTLFYNGYFLILQRIFPDFTMIASRFYYSYPLILL